jgi:hypothetical protein
VTQLIEFQLSGGKSIFVEADPEILSAERQLSSRDVGNQITKKFDEIAETLGAVAESIEEQLSKLAKAPKKVEVELHATVKAGGKLFIAEGSAEGGIKLRLTWER